MSTTAMKFTVKVTLGTGIAFLAFAWIGVFTYRSAVQADQDRGWVTHTRIVLQGITALESDMTTAETAQRGYILTGESSYQQPFLNERDLASKDLQQLRDLTADNPVQQHNLDQLGPMVAQAFEVMQDRIEIRTQRGIEAAAEAVKQETGKRVMEDIRTVTLAMKQEEETLLQGRMDQASAASLRTRRVIVFGNAMALLFLMLAGFMIQKEMDARKRGQDEIRRLNHDLEERVKDLVVANRELDAFTHSLAHDLRAPLRHMHGFAELLREAWYDRFDEDGRYFLGKVLCSSREMGVLVDDLLNFSRLARVDVQTGDVDPRELVEKARRELEPETTGRSITWQIGAMERVRADPALLYQVLFNLVANAVKYTRKSEAARIEVGSMSGGGDGLVTMFVRDNGAGFDMQYADKLFRVFQRLHRAEDFEGTGVGLANVRRIVERHGGRVWAEGETAQGATFYFSIPAASLPTSAVSIRRQDDEQARVHSAGR